MIAVTTCISAWYRLLPTRTSNIIGNATQTLQLSLFSQDTPFSQQNPWGCPSLQFSRRDVPFFEKSRNNYLITTRRMQNFGAGSFRSTWSRASPSWCITSKSVSWRRACSKSTARVLTTSLMNSGRRLIISTQAGQEIRDCKVPIVYYNNGPWRSPSRSLVRLLFHSEYEAFMDVSNTISELEQHRCFVHYYNWFNHY